MPDVSREEFDALVQRVTKLEGIQPQPTGLQVKATPQIGAVKVDWVPTIGKPVLKFEAGRDGVDTSGSGVWTGTYVASARTTTFDKLKNQAYKFTVKAFYTDGTTEQQIVRAIPAPVIVVPPTTDTKGIAWLSGVSDTWDRAQGWEKFRGTPLTYMRVWSDSDRFNMLNLPSMADVTRGGYKGTLDLACGGPSDWGDAASGGFDGVWRQQCRQAYTLWGGLRELHLSPAHEFNNGYEWKVDASEQANFRKGWARFYSIVQEELVERGKNAKVFLSCNSDTNSGWRIDGGLPDPEYIDGIGVDFYSMWPPLDSQAAWDANLDTWKGGTPRGIRAWKDFAKQIKKPISFPEWGLNPSQPNNPTDNPFFIRAMYDFFRSIAPVDAYKPGPGELAGEAYFNAWTDHGQFLPQSSSAPKSRDAYLALKWGVV